MNLYEALIGATPEGPEQTKAIADELRRKHQFGVLGQITGDATLAPTGAGMVKSAMAGAKQLQDTRQKESQREILKNYYDEQAKQHEEKMQYRRDRDPVQDQLARDLAKMQASSRSNRMMQDLWRYRKDLGRDMVKSGLPEIKKSITQIDEALIPYAEGNIPGFGAGKYDPRAEARMMRNKLAPIENILLKARSGAAVTPHEYERFRRELLGEGVMASDADFRRAWADLKARIQAHEDSILATYDPIVVDYYLSGESLPEELMEGGEESVSGPAYLMDPSRRRDFEDEYGLGED